MFKRHSEKAHDSNVTVRLNDLCRSLTNEFILPKNICICQIKSRSRTVIALLSFLLFYLAKHMFDHSFLQWQSRFLKH